MIERLAKWLGIHVHEWSKWKETGQIVSTVHEGIIGTVQSRTCETCGKRQAEKIWLG